METTEAIAAALTDAGVGLVTNFPGFHSQEVQSFFGTTVTSVNEKSSYEIAWGYSMSGGAAAVSLKNVGLNDAADPFLNSMLTGVRGSLVVVVFDDIELEGSQCILDSRNYYRFLGGLWLEPWDLQSAYDLTRLAVEKSNEFDIPVVLRITNKNLLSGNITRNQTIVPLIKRTLDSQQYVVHPTNARRQRSVLAEKLERIQAAVDTWYPDKTQKITYGAQETTGIRGFTIPSPSWAKEVEEIGDPIVRSTIKYPVTLASPPRDEGSKYIISSNYRKIMRAVKEVQYDIVFGDLGEYTADVDGTINACLCFGSAPAAALGARLAGTRSIAITGDGAWLHSGKNTIPEMIEREAYPQIILLDNDGMMGVGGRRVPGSIENACRPLGFTTITYENTTTKGFERILIATQLQERPPVLRVIL